MSYLGVCMAGSLGVVWGWSWKWWSWDWRGDASVEGVVRLGALGPGGLVEV